MQTQEALPIVEKPKHQTVYWLAADRRKSRLVTTKAYSHWADAYLAAISGGKAEYRRYKGKEMRPLKKGRIAYVGAGISDDDDEAKDDAGRYLRNSLADNPLRYSRFTEVRIVVDTDGYLVIYRTLGVDHRELLDAVIYGCAAGYKLRPKDQLRFARIIARINSVALRRHEEDYSS
ncbi:MAG: hypothetical protein LBQ75_09285 [Zoogloeaceae bacterium]|jgi:hypothetical protein|nr:hypothetical protein [Zoogloeaceae bacterium]